MVSVILILVAYRSKYSQKSFPPKEPITCAALCESVHLALRRKTMHISTG